jgi:hypothetical protein
MILKVAKNIDEYLFHIKQIKSEMNSVWFRGQSNSDYMLLPSLYRRMCTINGMSAEAVIMRPPQRGNTFYKMILLPCLNSNSIMIKLRIVVVFKLLTTYI